MDRARKPKETEQLVYDKLLSQLEVGYYSGHVRLSSVEFRCPEDAMEYPMEPIEKLEISWDCSFEKSENGFTANVTISNRIVADHIENESIDLEIGYNLYYGSKVNLPESLAKRFAREKVLAHVWPYFRQQAIELYFKAGLRWVVLPFEPPMIAGR